MAGRSYNNNGYDGERYERYNFNATEDDYIVCDILINLESLILNSNPRNSYEPEAITCSFKSSSSYEPTWISKARNLREPLWLNKRKRSALDNPPSPSPPRIEMKNEGHKLENTRIRDVKTGEKEENLVYSPSSPLSYEPIDDNHIQYHLKHRSKKRKVQDWEGRIGELEQTKQQLKLSLDNVKRYHQTLMELNTKLQAKRDEKKGELRRKNLLLKVNGGFDRNFQTGHHQFPVFARQQQQQQQREEYAYQKGGEGRTPQYYPVSYFQANAKVLQAAEARHRRRIKIKTKKNSNSLGIRSTIT
ncbi:hypothetical protein POM88_016715 [Heracleum sosnowskyi]|uniref:Uncharacterized protein n=1 Tax=Heracleum sosnowskyi TaxID=360622 RepID=A0AAD8IMJ0_9APIA|nr:hypothetical protein POM88_016715 [Heracleum sosnowskyi]